jgi:hypothetical protein
MMGNCLCITNGERWQQPEVHRGVRPDQELVSFVSTMVMGLAVLVPFVSVVHGGRWYVKGLGMERHVRRC